MATTATKGYKGIGMEGPIAAWYTRVTANNVAEDVKAANLVAEHTPAGSAVLELAPGPGYLAVELARRGQYRVFGLDISESFVRIARQKAQEAGVSVDFRHGDAGRMPFDDATFDFIICKSAFKNFAKPVQALNEIHRVLKPGGKAVILDLRGDASLADINRAVDDMGLGRVNRFITRWTFRNMLIKRAYTRDRFEQLVAESAFKRAAIRQELITLQIWLEK